MLLAQCEFALKYEHAKKYHNNLRWPWHFLDSNWTNIVDRIITNLPGYRTKPYVQYFSSSTSKKCKEMQKNSVKKRRYSEKIGEISKKFNKIHDFTRLIFEYFRSISLLAKTKMLWSRKGNRVNVCVFCMEFIWIYSNFQLD